MGDNFAAVFKTHIGEKPFVTSDQRGGHKWGLKAHGRGLYRDGNAFKELVMPNPTAAMLVIGDEILSGRTRDANMHYLAGQLTKAGIDLREVRVVSDDHDQIVEAVRALSAAYHTVFTSGGIGPTHDDITAEAIGAGRARSAIRKALTSR